MNLPCMKSTLINPIYGLMMSIALLSITGYVNAQRYNFDHPDKVITLPVVLREVSDITMLSNSVVACIQDEQGIVFRFDLKKGTIVSRDSFFVDGDYEGITKVKNDLYVLRSDGMLIEIKNLMKGKLSVQTYVMDIPAANNEGL